MQRTHVISILIAYLRHITGIFLLVNSSLTSITSFLNMLVLVLSASAPAIKMAPHLVPLKHKHYLYNVCHLII